MTAEKTAGEGTQEVDTIKAKLKERGFDSVEDLLADRDGIAEDRDKYQERHTNAEKLVQRQGAELGQLRKVAGVKPPDGAEQNEPGSTAQPKSVEEQLAEVQATLTKDQREAADSAFKNASDEEKVAIARDPAAKLALMRHAQQSVVSVPDTLFSSPTQKTGESTNESSTLGEDRIRELFQKERKAGSFYPDAPRASSNTGGSGGETEQRPVRRPVGSGGVLERINRDKATGVR